MFICKEVLTKAEVADVLTRLTEWEQGNAQLGKDHKDNQEIKGSPVAEFITQKIASHEKVKLYGFFKQMMTPMFNRYKDSGKYNRHVDFFIQNGVRTDWSMTLFLSEPDTYEGGELIIQEQPDKETSVKLEAGDMVMYQSGNIHRVTPVTKGERIAAVTWAESFVEDHNNRQILYKVVEMIKKYQDVELSYIYNNLLRKWS